jgi:hypothetical protein
MHAIKSPQDFLAGLFYIAVGATAVIVAPSYGIGTAARMGAGFFPVMLGSLLIGIGVLAFLRGVLRQGEGIGVVPWRALVLITLAAVTFAATVNGLGFIVSATLTILISALAARDFPWRPTFVLILLAVVAAVATLFITLLAVPLPLVGSWLR